MTDAAATQASSYPEAARHIEPSPTAHFAVKEAKPSSHPPAPDPTSGHRMTGEDLIRRVRVDGAVPKSEELGSLIVLVSENRCRNSFAILFEYFAPRLKAYLRRQGASDSMAEELAQEAMVTLWRKADRYDPARASAGTWLFTIARNLRIDVLRKEKRPEVDLDDPMLVPDAPEQGDAVVEGQQRDAVVRRAIAELPEDQASVIRLSFYEDMTHTEIAERLDIPLGTVKSRLRLAFRKVKSSIGENT